MKEVLGAQPLEAGYRKSPISPYMGDLKWAKGSVPTPFGPISVEWKWKADGLLDITWSAPSECDWWMFRKSFVLQELNIKSAELKITANLNYVTYINGTVVTRGPLLSFDFSKVYETMDISQLLNPAGENVIALVSIQEKDAKDAFMLESYGVTQGLLVEISILSADGTVEQISSDETWRVKKHLSFKKDIVC